MHPKIDPYIDQLQQWKEETRQLRDILLDCDLEEDFKWGKPCYCYEQQNIVVIQGFKSYFALLFLKGALLDDPEKVLQKTGPNTEVGRQMRFENVKTIKAMEMTIRSYINEAKKKAHLKVESKPASTIDYPDELLTAFTKDADFKKAFEALTSGRQKSYLLYFSGAKQAKTRSSRIEKCKGKVIEGKGHNER